MRQSPIPVATSSSHSLPTGFKVFIYYFDQYAGVIGGFVADCIKK